MDQATFHETPVEKISRRDNRSAAVMKVMGIFSGVQVITILCSVVRTKLVALFIGAAGVGLFGIFNSAIDMLASLTTLGIGASSVRDMASASGRARDLAGVVVRRLGLILGIFGAMAMLLLAPWLSSYSFHDTSHTWQFMLLAVCMFFNTLTSTNNAVMQGFRRYRNLANASVWGAIGSVLVSAPLFYFLGIDSIIPAIITFSVVTFAASWLNRVRLPSIPATRAMLWENGRDILRLGAYMTVSGFTGYLVSYVFISWLSTTADVSTAGYYQAGLTLFNRYAGLIFTAIGVEYFPRLSSVSGRAKAMSLYVNHEAMLLMWMLTVIVPLFILCAPLIIRVLYTDDFLVMVPMVTFGITGTVLRGISWCMSFTILARGDGRLFLITEVLSSAICLALNIIGYRLAGLGGLGASYTVWYAAYTLIVWIVYRRVYGLSLRRATVCHTAAVFGVSAAAAIAAVTQWWWANIPVAVMCAIVGVTRLKALYR